MRRVAAAERCEVDGAYQYSDDPYTKAPAARRGIYSTRGVVLIIVMQGRLCLP